MNNLIIKVAGYIALRYLFFLASVYATGKDARFVKSSDLKNGEDFFYFFWLFGVPVLIDFIIIGLPLTYGLARVNNSNKFMFYLLFAGLFLIEFIVGNWMYGSQSAIIKVGISLFLFLILFWKCIF